MLERSIRRLHRFLSDGFPFSWRIVIADNASIDAHAGDRRRLARELPRRRVPAAGAEGPRPRAARRLVGEPARRSSPTWTSTSRPTCAALLPLVAPLLSGHSDLAIGTRLAHGARVVRGPKRELISRGYNRLLRTALRARFTDAQCGFKAVRRDALDGLLGDVRDDGWFFDTELLVLAQRRGLRIHEVPVDWVDDPDSRVDIVRTAIDRPQGRRAAARRRRRSRAFMGIGVLSTIAYALLYLLLRRLLGALGATPPRWRSPPSATPPPTGG